MLGKQPTMPAQSVPSVTSRWRRMAGGSSRANAAKAARSVQLRAGLGFVLRSAMTSCRNTSSSASFDADDRASSAIQANSRVKIKYS